MSFHVPEGLRLKIGRFSTSKTDGNNGAFEFKHNGRIVRIIASDGAGWEHVSVSLEGQKMPGWNLMCQIKDVFWDKEDTVIQYHPAMKDYVNHHPACFHLWKPVGVELPCPPSHLIGPK